MRKLTAPYRATGALWRTHPATVAEAQLFGWWAGRVPARCTCRRSPGGQAVRRWLVRQRQPWPRWPAWPIIAAQPWTTDVSRSVRKSSRSGSTKRLTSWWEAGPVRAIGVEGRIRGAPRDAPAQADTRSRSRRRPLMAGRVSTSSRSGLPRAPGWPPPPRARGSGLVPGPASATLWRTAPGCSTTTAHAVRPGYRKGDLAAIEQAVRPADCRRGRIAVPRKGRGMAPTLIAGPGVGLLGGIASHVRPTCMAVDTHRYDGAPSQPGTAALVLGACGSRLLLAVVPLGPCPTGASQLPIQAHGSSGPLPAGSGVPSSVVGGRQQPVAGSSTPSTTTCHRRPVELLTCPHLAGCSSLPFLGYDVPIGTRAEGSAWLSPSSTCFGRYSSVPPMLPLSSWLLPLPPGQRPIPSCTLRCSRLRQLLTSGLTLCCRRPLHRPGSVPRALLAGCGMACPGLDWWFESAAPGNSAGEQTLPNSPCP